MMPLIRLDSFADLVKIWGMNTSDKARSRESTPNIWKRKVRGGQMVERESRRMRNTEAPPCAQRNRKALVLVHHIHLPNNYSRRRNHRSNDQWKIQFTELPWANVDTLLPQNVPPEQPGQRGAYRQRERAIVGSDRKRVYSSITLFRVNSVPHSGDPNLENSSGEDRRPDIGTTNLARGSGNDT